MSVRPIIFSAPMVKALLAGTKTQTRRVAKITAIMGNRVAITSPDESLIELEPGEFKRGVFHYLSTGPLSGPYDARFAVGDVLYVREAHYLTDDGDNEYAVYTADGNEVVGEHLEEIATLERRYPQANWSKHKKLRPSIHMPRWASRLTLAVTDVRVERLQDISEADAQAEGTREPSLLPVIGACWSERDAFAKLWNSINGPAAWAENPWIVAVTFQTHRQNVDQYLAAPGSALPARVGLDQ